jgi:hypothetical protein
MLPDPEHFLIQERDGLRLITPKASSALADHVWIPANIHYRSRLETLRGETVSQGFKKFMNLGQGPDGLRVSVVDVVKACIRGDAVATVKIDGSLIVRSVHQGRVLLRTRGAFGYQHQENAYEIETCVQRYPRLLDPTYRPEYSLLLDWVSPTNVIILKYAEADLLLVGGVDHEDLRYLRLRELADIAGYLGVPLVEYFRLDERGWKALYDTLATDAEKEGYVIRLYDEQTLVKVKCTPYIAKHAFKYGMSEGKLVDMWLQVGRPPQQSFIASLISQFDEETIMWALPFITSLFRWVQAVEERVATIQQEVERQRGLVRKQFALHMQRQLHPRDFSLAMLLLDRKPINDRLMRQFLEEQMDAPGAATPRVVEE